MGANGLALKQTPENVQLTHAAVQREPRKFPISIVAHDIEIALNVGSLFRIADALGVERLYLCGTTPSPPDRKIKKMSRSTEKHVPFVYRESALDTVRELKAEGYCIASLELTSQSIDIRRFSPKRDQKICLILGAENEGVPPALLDASDVTVHIPMFGNNSSLNVAVACSIALYHLIQKYTA